jgi:branched-chain amino acid transport system substrate-binding protein
METQITHRRRAMRVLGIVLVSGSLVATACGSTHGDGEFADAPAAQTPTSATGPAALGGDTDAAAATPSPAAGGEAVTKPAAAGNGQAATGGATETNATVPARVTSTAGAALGGGAKAPTTAGSPPAGSAAAPAPTPGPAAPSPGAAPAAPGTPAVASGPKAEIVLGSIGTASGLIGELMGPTIEGAKAWLTDVNSRGGVNGHPVRIVFGDDGGDPGRALALAKRMVDEDKVVAFIAGHGPGTFQSITPFLEERKIPEIGSCNCALASALSPMAFSVGTTSDVGLAWSHVLPLLAFSNERNISVMYCREVPACRAFRDALVKFAASAGLRIVHEAQVTLSQPDYTAEVVAARNAGAKAISLGIDSFSVVRLARSAHRQGFFPELVTQYSVHDERFLKDGGKDIEGVLVSASILHWDSPKLADWRKAIARIPGAIKHSFSIQAWTAGKLIELIGRGFPAKPTSADFLRGLYALNGETLGGMIPPLTYIEGKGSGPTNYCVVPTRIQDGKFVPKNGDEHFCAPGWQPVRN